MKDHNEQVLKEAMEKIIEEENEELLKEMEIAKTMPELQVKEGEAEAFVEKYMSKKSNKKKALMRVASVAVAVIVCFSAVTLSVDGFKESISKFVNNLSSSISASIKLSDDENDAKLATYEGQYIPTYIPKGYEVEEVANSEAVKSITLSNKSGNTIMFTEQVSDVNLNVDTENADSVEEVEVNGMQGLKAIKGNLATLVIKTESSVIHIACNDNDIDIVGFAKLVERR